MIKRLLILILIAQLGFIGKTVAQNGTMGWVFLDPGATNGGCTSASDCANDVVCYGLQYTPGYTGVLTSYTTGWFITCPSTGNAVITNVSCVMPDNSLEFDVCASDGFTFTNSSGNSGSAADNTVEAGLTYIVHQICFSIPVGETILIIEDEISNLTTNIDFNWWGFSN